MALTLWSNRIGPLLLPGALSQDELSIAYTNRTMNAAGESYFGVGHLRWSDGGSHTVSSAGGSIFWYSGTTTFANGSTTLRVGIQDLASGLEDGTFDVYAELVGGTDTITSNVPIETTMETGTKTIASGDLVAIGLEMTAFGGADSVIARSVANVVSHIPYTTFDTGSGPTRQATKTVFAVKADDGTFGWIHGSIVPFVDEVTAVSDTTNPDEIALLFSLPVPIQLKYLAVALNSALAADTFDLKLYTDPLGTPTQQRTVSVDPTNSSQTSTTGLYMAEFSSAYDLAASVLYGLAVRGTATAFNLQRYSLAAAGLRAPFSMGTSMSYGARQNSTGAFSETTTLLPRIGFFLTGLDDGAAGGGGNTYSRGRVVNA